MSVEVVVAWRPGAPELDILRRLGARVQLSAIELRPGRVALGHGGEGGVGDQHGNYVLTAADATTLKGGWAFCVACNTDGFAQLLAARGVSRAGGYTVSLNLPGRIEGLEPPLAELISALAVVVAELDGIEADRAKYAALDRTLDELRRSDNFMAVHFAEQLVEALRVHRRSSG